jgi:hypothetical protein
MQCVFIRTPKNHRYQVRPIEIRAEGHKISSEALRTFNTAANTGTSHRMSQQK